MAVLRIPILVTLLAAAACGEPPAARAPAAAAPAAKKVESPASAAPEAAPALEYAYSAVGKRDPFRSVIDDQKLAVEGDSARPDCGPLCKWELEQLKLVGVVSGVSNPLAMVEDPGGRGYVVRRGTFVGKRNGKVTQIHSGEIVITEIYKDPMGKPHANAVPIKLPADQPSNQEEDANLLSPEVGQ